VRQHASIYFPDADLNINPFVATVPELSSCPWWLFSKTKPQTTSIEIQVHQIYQTSLTFLNMLFPGVLINDSYQLSVSMAAADDDDDEEEDNNRV